MPTTRPRYTVTETDQIKRALDGIARLHPELSDDRNAQFRHLVNQALRQWDDGGRLHAIEEVFTRIEARGLRYPPNYLADLRKEWPE